jgi:protein involved in polysaccharide export with SLBB domain
VNNHYNGQKVFGHGGNQLKCLIRTWRFAQHRTLVSISILSFLFLAGCGARLSSSELVTEFKKAGPIQTAIDSDPLAKGRPRPYQVIPGDVLEFQMDVDLRIISSELVDWHRPTYGVREEPYLVRVSDTGTITLPIIGDIHVVGKTLAEIEALVKNAYYPKYVVNSPMLFCRVEDYQGKHERVFTVMGLVKNPDAYDYPPDVHYNLLQALAFAGGLDMVADPRYLKVFRQDADGQVLQATFGTDDKELTNAYQVAIKPGDVIYVDHTLRTRMNTFLSNLFRLNVGYTADYDD